jgi:tetratricopeptide (TPR) repeat protein
MEQKPESNIAQRQLPWIVAGAALLLYLVTSTASLTFMGLGTAIRVGHMNWLPVYTSPLYYLLTYPIHWLPPGWQIGALNGFSIICAAVTLGLLARSVALLPHDRTRYQRSSEHDEDGLLSIRSAWLPVSLAVLVCGLQRTFWEHAVVGTGEMLDLLLFAYVIRCFLEYRIGQNDSWLYRLALVYGLGVANNFAMIGFFPAALVALVWIKGRSFFNLGFCARMGLLGLAGLMLYFLLPITQLFYSNADLSFWNTLRMNMGQQKAMLMQLFSMRLMLILTGVTSLAPVLLMGIRWPDGVGDISNAGNFLTNLMTHVLHGFFGLACVYVAFDPPFSPRELVGAYGYVFLTAYYLGALSVGYFGGYFLLVFGKAPEKSWQRSSPLMAVLKKGIVGLVWLALLALPTGLVVKNWPGLQATTSKYLSQFGVTAAQQLKEASPKGAIVLSDDAARLYSTYQALREQSGASNFVLVESASLVYPSYQRYLHEQFPQVWPLISTNISQNDVIDPMTLIGLMSYLSASNSIYYLHPTFGYYMEKFYFEPHKLINSMKSYASNSVDSPLLTDGEAKQNEDFWKQYCSKNLGSLARVMKASDSKKGVDNALFQSGVLYSKGLNQMGVELQKSGRLAQAAECFTWAADLNPLSISALRNLEVNQALRAGKKELPKPGEKIESKFVSVYGKQMNLVLSIGGAVDDNVFGFEIASIFARGRNYRQAAQYLERVLKFEPQNISAKAGLVGLYNSIRQPELALKTLAELRAQPQAKALPFLLEMELIQSEANAYLTKEDVTRAIRILDNARLAYPTNIEPYLMLNDYYLQKNDLTNSLRIIELEMKALPSDSRPLIEYARVKMLNSQFAEAIPYLDKAVKLDGKSLPALFNRAVAHLKLKQLDEAQGDYRKVESLQQKPDLSVIYGLHEVAWQKKDYKLALRYAELFLKGMPPNAEEYKMLDERVRQIKKGLK